MNTNLITLVATEMDNETLKVAYTILKSRLGIVDTVQSNTVPTLNTNTVSKEPTTKPTYVATKDFTPKFKVDKKTSTDGTTLFCISRDNGWTKAEKQCMNNSIKALNGIITISVEYTDKNGKSRTYSAWGYKTQKKANEMLATLPTVYTVDELNA